MSLLYNLAPPRFCQDRPYLMHIDLNSCFATIEQQANRLLRGRPVAVSAYDTPRGMVLASSYEAKRLGIKLGVNNRQARELSKDVVILTPDPSKYREAHKRFERLLLDFSPDVTPKSIDEFVLDMSGSLRLKNVADHQEHCRIMLEIAREVKQRIKQDLGEWVTVNVGISTNRFLAKYAAGFGKPDGLTLIDHHNLEDSYRDMQLVDLPGINVRYAARLMAAGIHTPLNFLEADVWYLKKIVFKSVLGHHWWSRLRGFEVDNRTFSTKSIGHQYALPKKSIDKRELERILMKLCEKVGRRLRKKEFCARGIHLYIGYARDSVGTTGSVLVRDDHYSSPEGPVGFENMHKLRSWHEGQKLGHRLYATTDIFGAAQKLLQRSPEGLPPRIIAITVYGLEPWSPEQLSIFDTLKSTPPAAKQGAVKMPVERTEYSAQETTKRLSDAMDQINSRYGEFVISPATMVGMDREILDRIAFSNRPD